jgi:hypothetical protein
MITDKKMLEALTIKLTDVYRILGVSELYNLKDAYCESLSWEAEAGDYLLTHRLYHEMNAVKDIQAGKLRPQDMYQILNQISRMTDKYKSFDGQFKRKFTDLYKDVYNNSEENYNNGTLGVKMLALYFKSLHLGLNILAKEDTKNETQIRTIEDLRNDVIQESDFRNRYREYDNDPDLMGNDKEALQLYYEENGEDCEDSLEESYNC